MGAREVMDRVDVLLQDQDLTASRRLHVPLVKASAHVTDQRQAWPPAATDTDTSVYYLLREGGDPGTFRDIISGDGHRKELRLVVALFVRLGAKVEVESTQYQERARQLAETWDDVVDVLQDPNNHNRVLTGWVEAHAFTSQEPSIAADRLVKLGSFVARYRRVHTGEM